MSAVFTTVYTPSRSSGHGLRSYSIVRAMAEHEAVDVVFARFGADEPDPAYAALDGVRLHGVEASRGAARALAFGRALAGGVPSRMARGVSPELIAATEAVARPGSRVVADGPVAAAALAGLARRRPVVYCGHNLESAFRHELGRSLPGDRALLRRFERRVLLRSAESWMVSPADVRGAQELAPGARVRLVPNVVDVAAIEPLPERAGERQILFVGQLAYPPNRRAVEFLLGAGMPALWRTDPDVRLLVVGRGGGDLVSHDPRAVLAGFVEDLREPYETSGCAVVPLMQSGGSPLKFVEALAHRLPVAATPLAAQGLAVEPGRDYFPFEPEPEAFAAAVRAALDPARAAPVAAAGRRLAERVYSIESLSEVLAP